MKFSYKYLLDIIMCDNGIITEVNLGDLKKDTKMFFGPEREKKAQRVQVSNIIYIPSIKNKILQVKADTTSEGKNIYKTFVVFNNIDIDLERSNENMVRFKAPSGFYYYFTPVDINDDVRVSCSCLDFYYRFAVFDDQHQALFGKRPPPYIKKTDRPYVNPFKTPGVCKHTIALMNKLKRRNFFKNF
jgi:hypothetical protein